MISLTLDCISFIFCTHNIGLTAFNFSITFVPSVNYRLKIYLFPLQIDLKLWIVRLYSAPQKSRSAAKETSKTNTKTACTASLAIHAVLFVAPICQSLNLFVSNTSLSAVTKRAASFLDIRVEIFCHPERSAKHGAEGSSQYRKCQDPSAALGMT